VKLTVSVSISCFCYRSYGRILSKKGARYSQVRLRSRTEARRQQRDMCREPEQHATAGDLPSHP
jgi:hypothetical protein